MQDDEKVRNLVDLFIHRFCHVSKQVKKRSSRKVEKNIDSATFTAVTTLARKTGPDCVEIRPNLKERDTIEIKWNKNGKKVEQDDI